MAKFYRGSGLRAIAERTLPSVQGENFFGYRFITDKPFKTTTYDPVTDPAEGGLQGGKSRS